MLNNKIKILAFSIIELMVVVTIIGILASIAVPSYNSYRVKAVITEGLSVLDILKQKSVEFYNQNAAFPSLADINSSSKAYTTTNIDSVNIINTSGEIQVIFSSTVPCVTCTGASGAPTRATLNLVPSAPASGASVSTSIISWRCGSQSIAPSYLPSACTFGVGSN